MENRFAADCMTKMNQLATELESSLGPDTGDLAMRFGLHSGPVTAGVLRGERARFQLFGDTVNTAARYVENIIPIEDCFPLVLRTNHNFDDYTLIPALSAWNPLESRTKFRSLMQRVTS